MKRPVAWLLGLAWLALTPSVFAADCSTRESVTERVLCHAERAVAADEMTRCDTAKDVRVRDQCYGVFAVRTGRPAACRAIPGDGQRPASLRQICLSDVAIVTGEAALCGEIGNGNLRDTCYLKLHRDTGDAGLCERIDEPALRALCKQ
jgi:hypothetical protein